MFKHYYTVAVRSLARQKVLAFINVFGLSLGIACFTLFLLYAVNELNFDKFHKNANNIYRVYEWVKGLNGGADQAGTNLPMPLGPAIQQDLPDVINAVRVRPERGSSLVRVNNQISRVNVTYADPKVFFSFYFSTYTWQCLRLLFAIRTTW
jgi:putative ABC transport system permease protein